MSLDVLSDVLPRDIALLGPHVRDTLGILPLCTRELATAGSRRVTTDIGTCGIVTLVIGLTVSSHTPACVLCVEHSLRGNIVVVVASTVSLVQFALPFWASGAFELAASCVPTLLSVHVVRGSRGGLEGLTCHGHRYRRPPLPGYVGCS